jgi:S-DNA-T family DNA segregation ATPase FtsK/SpoIIIE
MARQLKKKYKIKKKKKGFLSRLLPETFQAFIARRIVDITGSLFCLVGLGLFFSFISYNSGDPSFNVAAGSDTITQNWMGSAGAHSADMLLQIFGGAAFLSSFIFLIWGGSIIKRRPLPLFWSRLVALFVALFSGAATMARVPSGDWLVQAYAGGSAGQGILQAFADTLHAMGIGHEYLIASLFFAGITFVMTAFACAVSRAEFQYFRSLAWYGISSAGVFFADHAISFYNWVKHYNDPDYKPKTTLKRAPKPPLMTKPEPVKQETVLKKHDIAVVAPEKVTADNSTGGQNRFPLFDGGEWEFPSVDLLQEVPDDNNAQQMDENALRMNAELLQNVLEDFNIQGEIVSIHPGPVVTLYELEPAPGTKSSRVIGLADDIARSMSAVSVRAAVVPGRNVIGIEIPNQTRQTVYMREMVTSKEYNKTQAKLPMVLGKDIGGKPIIADLARMPHLLVAGTTGSGKSVGVNTMILSLLYQLPPEKCRFIMIDPKMLELSVYNDIPHLLSPVVTEPGKAVVALKWLVGEMEERYRSMSKLGVRNIDGYNARLAEARKKGEALMRKVQTGFDPETGKAVYEEQPLDLTDLPYIVVIVDEFADLMLVAGKDVEAAIQRLAQMARAAGIHIIMATQRPSVDVITGVIKANFPTRISFAVTSKIDSRTILGDGGAEQLLGMGDMLYMAAGGQIKRVHGPFSSDEDVENVVNFLKSQAEPSYLDDVTEDGGDITGAGLAGMYGDSDEKVDELYDQAVALVTRERKASTSFVQRYLQIGYNRAARIIEEMERQGVIGPANHVGKREILASDMSEDGMSEAG